MDWVKNLKIGDKVVVERRGLHSLQRIDIVKNITPTGLINVSGTLYRADGSSRGNDWTSEQLLECTKEVELEINKKKVIRKVLRDINEIKSLTYEQAVEIMDILEV